MTNFPKKIHATTDVKDLGDYLDRILRPTRRHRIAVWMRDHQGVVSLIFAMMFWTALIVLIFKVTAR